MIEPAVAAAALSADRHCDGADQAWCTLRKTSGGKLPREAEAGRPHYGLHASRYTEVPAPGPTGEDGW